MELAKVAGFIKKYKSFIFLPIICLLQCLACFYYDLWIVATCVAVALILISDFAHIIYYMLFFQMFSVMGDFSVIVTFVGSGVIFGKYLWGLIKHSEKIYPMPLILTFLICVLWSIPHTVIDGAGIYQGSSLIVSLFVCYLAFVYRDRFRLSRCADFLICGILATLCISGFNLLLDGSFLEIFHGHDSFRRLRLLTGNENSLSIYCSLSLSIYITRIINGKGKLVKNILFGLVAMSVGLSTLSKCFLIVCAFMLVYLFIMLIYKHKLKSIYFILPALIIIIIIAMIFQTTISNIITRFFSVLDKTLTLSIITTGRSDLWTIYINKITSSVPNMLFGVGLFSERLVKIGPHNLLLHLLYRMGFVGVFMLGILAYYYYKASHKTLKPTIYTAMPMFVFILISMVENFL